jgi:hypothetical protein
MPAPFTILEGDRETRVDAQIEGDLVRLTPSALEASLGWRLEDQGLCRGDVCVPIREGAGIVVDGWIDLAAFAEQTQSALALDVSRAAACVTGSATERGAVLSSLVAPDFTLPDLDGKLHSLSDFRGKKVLLAVYASW